MPKQILLVDDSLTIHRVVEITFAQEDFALTTVTSADEGIEKAKSLKPDLVLVDATLPGKSGYDVVSAIRAHGELGHTACILLTGNFAPYDEARGSSVGADGFVVKPFDTQAMIDKAKDAISRRVSGGTTAQPVAAMPKPAAAPTVLSPPPVIAAPPVVPTPASAATVLSPPPNLAAPRGAETLGKPLSSVAAEASQRVAVQPPVTSSQTAIPAIPSRPAPPAATLSPPPPARPVPKATLMGIAAVNPASMGLVPPAAAVAPPVVAKPVAPPPAAAKPSVLSPPPRPATPIAAPPPVHAMPQNVPTMPRPSLVPGVATPTAHAPEVSIVAPIAPLRPEGVPESTPHREVEPVVQKVAQKAVDAIPAAIAAKGPEFEALAKLSREVIEQIVWEVVPELAETIIRAELDRLVRERQNA